MCYLHFTERETFKGSELLSVLTNQGSDCMTTKYITQKLVSIGAEE